MKTSKRFLSLLLGVFVALSMVTIAPALAEESNEDIKEPVFSDMPDDWSTTALENAVANGLLQGNKGKILPDNKLTRAEMATIIVRAFGAEVKGDLKDYVDVDANEWYADDMARAFKMGVIKGTHDKMNPNNNITREEVFAVIARAFKLQPASTIDEDFSDVEDITEWATGEVFALVNNGYVHGTNGKLNPKNDITRAEFAQLMYNISKQYIKAEGVVTEVEEGNVIVNTPNATLKDITVNGDLIIGDGVGEGEVTLENVEVTGRMVVRGGGTDSIIIKGNSKVVNVITVNVNGAVSVKVQDHAEVEVVYIEEGSNDVNIEGTVGNIEINAADITVNAVGAQIGEINHTGKNTVVVIDADSTVDSMNISGQASDAKVEVAGKITGILTEAENTHITGAGGVENVEVKAGANNTKIETPNTEIKVNEGAAGVVGAGGEEIEEGTTVKNNENGTGIIIPEPSPTPTTPPDNGGDPGSGDEDEDEDENEGGEVTDPDETSLSMTADNVSVVSGAEFTMPVNVKGSVSEENKDHKVRFYAVVSGLTADDIELGEIAGGTPEIVTDETERSYAGAQEGDLVLAWGPAGGFPLSSMDYSGEGTTTNFTAAINKAGNYTVNFVFYDIDTDSQLNAENETVVIAVTETE